jgi:hypothetical protein
MPTKITTKEFIERAKKVHGHKYDYSLINYFNSKTKIKIFCQNHGFFIQKPNNHLVGQGCPKCSKIILGATQRKNIEWLDSLAKMNNGKCLSEDYVNNKTKYLWSCQNSHKWRTTAKNISRGSWCPYCVHKIVENDYLSKLAIKNNGECLSNIFIGVNKKYEWKCNKGHIWKMNANSVQQGRWCPECVDHRNSKGIKSIKNFLLINSLPFIKEKRFENCRYKQPLPFDFYLPDHNCCIEYDGEQHFEVYGGWSTKEVLIRTQKSDSIKNDFCVNNEIKLIRIPYVEFKNINKILQTEFERGFDRSLDLSKSLHNKINSKVSITDGK